MPLRVFVLSTGRVGSVTLYAACKHITNFSTTHESSYKTSMAYPNQHIEVDNRLSWLVGRLPKDAYYVWLRRNREDIEKSFANYPKSEILSTFWFGILQRREPSIDALFLIRNYLDSVEANIALFLDSVKRSAAGTREIWIDNNLKSSFLEFWEDIKAEGDQEAALGELELKHNSTDEIRSRQ